MTTGFAQRLDALLEEHHAAGVAHEDLAAHLVKAIGKLIVRKARSDGLADLRARLGMGLLSIVSPDLAEALRRSGP